MKEQIIGLGSLLLVMSGMLLRSAAKVAITMGVLWLIGWLFPGVAASLGLPYRSLYNFVMDLYVGFLTSLRYLFGYV